MATNSVTLIDGTIAYASDVEDKVNPLYVDIDNSNIAASAGIVFSKLDAATVASVATVQTITGAKTFSALVTASAGLTVTGNTTLGTNLFVVDATNNRILEGATTTTTIDTVDYQHQITVLSDATPALALISTATGSTGVREARYHNSVSPANSDQIYHQKIYANNSAATIKEFARVTAQINTVTSGAENGLWYVSLMNAGALTNSFLVYNDQVQVRSESLVVGTTTNIGPDGFAVGAYTVLSDSNRRVACFSSTDATAAAAIFDIYKNSASPANSDIVAQLRFMGNDSGANYQNYADIRCTITDVTSGSEDANMSFRVVSSGSSVEFLSGESIAGTVTTTVTGTLAVVGVSNTITSTNSTGDALTITASSLTTGRALYVYSNASSASARNLVEITNDNSSADATACLFIQQDGDEPSISIDHNGSGASLYVAGVINSASDITAYSTDITNSGAGAAIVIGIGGGPDFIFDDSSGAFATGGGAGAYWGRFAVRNSAGNTKYVRLYDA